MQLQENGLYVFWWKDFTAKSDYCLKRIEQEKKIRDDDNKKPLTLKGLSGAFLVLAVGYALGILIFLLEIIFSHFKIRLAEHRNAVHIIAPVEADKKESFSVTEKSVNVQVESADRESSPVKENVDNSVKEKPIVEIVTVDIHSEADRESTAVIENAQVIEKAKSSTEIVAVDIHSQAADRKCSDLIHSVKDKSANLEIVTVDMHHIIEAEKESSTAIVDESIVDVNVKSDDKSLAAVHPTSDAYNKDNKSIAFVKNAADIDVKVGEGIEKSSTEIENVNVDAVSKEQSPAVDVQVSIDAENKEPESTLGVVDVDKKSYSNFIDNVKEDDEDDEFISTLLNEANSDE